MRVTALGLVVVLACGSGGSDEVPTAVTESATAPTATVLYAGRDGALVREDDGVRQVAIADPSVLDGLRVGGAYRLALEGGELVGAEAAGDGALPPGFTAGGHPLRGTVLGVEGDKLMVDHEAIDGVMAAMAMPFGVSDAVRGWARPGDQLEARLIATGEGFWLVDVLRTGRASGKVTFDVEPLAPGDMLPSVALGAARGSAIALGEGQGAPTVLTFLYTTCPDPAFCPALVARLQPLQDALPDDARIVAVTLDPERDTPDVLRGYAERVGAREGRWRFALPTQAQLAKLAQQAGLTIHLETGRIVHSIRILVLDADGRLVERYDDVGFPLERVVEQLR